MKKLLYTVILLIILNMTGTVASAKVQFLDMNSHWANDTVSELASVGVISGFPDGNFKPDEYINVDAYLKMVISALGYNINPSKIYWAAPYIETAKTLQLIFENEFDIFSRPATRYEMARIAARAYMGRYPSNVAEYAGKISDYEKIPIQFREYVIKVVACNIMNGYPDGTFSGLKNATRAEAVVVINRIIKANKSSGYTGPGFVQSYNENAVSPNSQNTIDIFVSPAGDDNNNGTIEKPLKTIQKAQEKIRLIKKSGIPKQGITIQLRGGVYELESGLNFNEEDSGLEGSPVVITSYKGELARITGGKQLSYSWFAPVTNEAVKNRVIDKKAASRLLQVDLKSNGIIDYGQIARRGFLGISANVQPQMELVIDGKRMSLGRWPNDEFVGLSKVIRKGSQKPSDITSGCEYEVDYDRIQYWKDAKDAFVSGVLGPNYAYNYFPVKYFDTATNKVVLREGGIADYYTKPFFYYENLLEEIDKPGEYYVDRENGILYLLPPEGFSPQSDIRVSMLKENMVTVKGVSNFEIKNILFDTSRESCMSIKGENIKIAGCEIRNFSKGGISANGNNISISRCNIHQIGYTAVSLSGGDYANLTPSQNIIENCEIHDFAYLERSYNTAIALGYRSVGSQIVHNKIYNGPHAAVIIYGCNHTVEYNDISDVVRDFLDMDAIYMNTSIYPWEWGNVIRYNYFHDFGARVLGNERQINICAIRTDNNGHGLTVEQNVFYNIGYQNANNVRGITAQGPFNVIKNNLFIDTSGPYLAYRNYIPDAKYDVTGKDKKVYDEWKIFCNNDAFVKNFPQMIKYYDNHPAASRTNVFEGNVVVNIAFALSTLNGNPDRQGFLGAAELVDAKNNFVTDKDPGFVDYKNKNFSLKQDSVVFQKIPGFPSIPFDEIGIEQNGY